MDEILPDFTIENQLFTTSYINNIYSCFWQICRFEAKIAAFTDISIY